MSEERECKIEADKLIINPSKTMAIIPKEAVELSKKYRSMSWDEMKESLELQLLVRMYAHLKDAKLILKGMGIHLKRCTFHYCRQNPLVIETPEGWSIAIAPRLIE